MDFLALGLYSVYSPSFYLCHLLNLIEREREKETERESVCVCVCERERAIEGEGGRKSMCVI